MSLRIGQNIVSDIYTCDHQVERIYNGSDLIYSAILYLDWVLIQNTHTYTETQAISAINNGEIYSGGIQGDDIKDYQLKMVLQKDNSRRFISCDNSIAVRNTIGVGSPAMLEYANSFYARTDNTNLYVSATYLSGYKMWMNHNGVSWELYVGGTLRYTWAYGTNRTYLRCHNVYANTIDFNLVKK